jgi:opacity protein-like surface antigen
MRRILVSIAASLAMATSAWAQGLLTGWTGGQISYYDWVPGIERAPEFAPESGPVVDRGRERALHFLALSTRAPTHGPLTGWTHGQITLYGWIPGIEGAQDFPDGEPVVDLDSASVLDFLDLAFFGTGEIRRDRVGLVFDIAYADLGQDGSARGTIVPGADPAIASVDTTLLMATGVVAYRFFDESGGWADVYGGIRAFDVDVDLDLRVPALGFAASPSASANWVDVLVGLRGHAPLGGRFSLTGLADVGGFGIGSMSDLTWQAQATLDYAFTERVSGRLGYRYMSIDYDDADLGLDIDLFGPLIGVTWTF